MMRTSPPQALPDVRVGSGPVTTRLPDKGSQVILEDRPEYLR